MDVARSETAKIVPWHERQELLSATPVREDKDPKTGAVTSAVGVTRIDAYTLRPGGAELVVERRGERSKIPPTLHDRPYDSATDPLVQTYTDVFVKSAQ